MTQESHIVTAPADRFRELFEPITLSPDLTLQNRITMLAMTRTRAEVDGTPSDLMVEYYRQRATAGLIISESTLVSEVGRGFLFAPGIYTTEHGLAWRRVVDAVHAEGGKIILQLNHVGRANNLQHRPRVLAPVGPSAIRIPRNSRKITINIGRVTPYDVPRALETEEVPLIVDEFRRGAQLAAFAGFDGVQVHADSGYLIHQFLSTNANRRTDRYGGSPQNRARFALEVLDAVCSVKGSKYVSIKLTPGFPVHEIEEDDITEKYRYLIDELNRRGPLMFLHLYFADLETSAVFRDLRARFKGRVLAEGSLKAERYVQMIREGLLDFTGVGRPFIANPDYPYRLQNGLDLSRADADTIYGRGPEGYVDYPAWNPNDPAGSVVGLDRPVPINTLLKAEA